MRPEGPALDARLILSICVAPSALSSFELRSTPSRMWLLNTGPSGLDPVVASGSFQRGPQPLHPQRNVRLFAHRAMIAGNHVQFEFASGHLAPSYAIVLKIDFGIARPEVSSLSRI